jgi:hypothetical protein
MSNDDAAISDRMSIGAEDSRSGELVAMRTWRHPIV